MQCRVPSVPLHAKPRASQRQLATECSSWCSPRSDRGCSPCNVLRLQNTATTQRQSLVFSPARNVWETLGSRPSAVWCLPLRRCTFTRAAFNGRGAAAPGHLPLIYGGFTALLPLGFILRHTTIVLNSLSGPHRALTYAVPSHTPAALCLRQNGGGGVGLGWVGGGGGSGGTLRRGKLCGGSPN